MPFDDPLEGSFQARGIQFAFEAQVQGDVVSCCRALDLRQDPEALLSIRQGVVPGSLVDRGSTVSLTVSAGPDRREVPDMRGLSVPEAERRIAELGLVLGAIDGAGQEVQGSEPPAGTMLPPGAAVFLWVPSQQ